MPSQPTSQIILTHFNWSLARLKEAIEKEDTEYYRGAALYRFRLTYDIALKTIRAFANEEGESLSADESCFQWLEVKQWLEKNSNWSVMQANYQRVINRPECEEADKIYNELRTHYILLNHLSERMKLAEE